MKEVVIHGRSIGPEYLLNWREMLRELQDLAMSSKDFVVFGELQYLRSFLLEMAKRLDTSASPSAAPDAPVAAPAPLTPCNLGDATQGIPAVALAPLGGAAGAGAGAAGAGAGGPDAVCARCGSGPWHAPGKRRAIVTWKQGLICSVCLMGELR